ncbi:hypothetical protein G4Y79_15175 [Phototrophicus methaneseepsis]|uniref:Uncharacterized protein n=1 Tax=Phototrophicus methaneseepsis TaxID=2710758 RepID=A0A7S8ID68_9CHLR|nr:hypothetical protein [Phototrophicus methaneseepsis]QPC81044.1 hypothetical protein G4Y79_15175 [Phototrophicus methaneseepsis]
MIQIDLLPGETFGDALDRIFGKDTMDALRATLKVRSAAWEAVIRKINIKYGCTLSVYTTACPVQIVGRLHDGQAFYFRERWGEWEAGIGASDELAHQAAFYIETPEGCFGWEGECQSEPSWMDVEEVAVTIISILREYNARLN